jgi:superfamily II DNA or RNA helicase
MEYVNGVHQQLLVAATGTGKTVIFSHLWNKMCHLLPGKMLIIVHREELVRQNAKSIQDWNPNLKVGIEMADNYASIDSDVIVSCNASIGREGAKRMLRFGWDNIDKIICDEAHHSIASTYMNIFQEAGVLLPDTKKLLVGFTATPKRKNLSRSDKKKVVTLDDEALLSLKSVYKKIVYSYPIRTAIKAGWLVPLKGFKVKTNTSLDGVKVVAGEYQQDQLSDAVNTPTRNQQVVKAWLDHAENRQSVGFTVDIQHAKDLAEMFKKNNINAEAVWGIDPERHTKIQRHKNKDITVLFNAQVLTEGYDDWRVRCILECAPTKSGTVFTQRVGRGTRLQEGTGNLLEAIAKGLQLEKKDCYVIDFVDNSSRCSLVTFPSLLGLPPEFDLEGKSVTETLEKIEALQEKYPGVDFSNLLDLNNVKVYVDSLDLFAAPYTEEVKEFSKLAWMATADSAYVLAIPEKREVKEQKLYHLFLHEKLHITQNELDEYELSITSTNTERKLGVYGTLQEAFTIAEDVIRRCRPDRMRLMTREEDWHKNPASDASKKLLAKLSRKKPLFYCLCMGGGSPLMACSTCGKKKGITAGQAALAINVLKAKGAGK